MAQQSKVSIVLPVHNGAERMRRSIDSCLNQTYKNIELVIVDDGSIDHTAEIIKAYKDKRIRKFRHKKNTGLPQALNTGFAHATGEFLTWTSDDNQYLPSAIEELLCFLKNNKEANLAYADYWAFFLDKGIIELRKAPNVLCLKKSNLMSPCFLYTRRVYEVVGAYNSKYRLVEDYDYWLRVSKKFKSVHYPKPLYIYGYHSKSLTSAKAYNIRVLANILRYRNGYISTSEFAETLKPPLSLKEFFRYLHSIVNVSVVSIPLCMLCFGLLARLSLTGLLTSLSKLRHRWLD